MADAQTSRHQLYISYPQQTRHPCRRDGHVRISQMAIAGVYKVFRLDRSQHGACFASTDVTWSRRGDFLLVSALSASARSPVRG